MRSLYLRIWLTVVAALALFALVSGWMWQRHVDEERARVESVANQRLAAWAEVVQRALPPADAPADRQAEAMLDWAARTRVPLALDDAQGRRIASTENFSRREQDTGATPGTPVRLDDGRTLWVARRGLRRAGIDAPPGGGLVRRDGWGLPGGPLGEGGRHRDEGLRPPFPLPPLLMGMPGALGPLVLVALLFVAVAAGAYPVVRRLTRRLEALKLGVAAFGAGDLGQRVDDSGHDEVAAVAATFNRTAERIETLVQSHRRLLANASHELRSPLARMKMAVAMLAELPEDRRAPLVREIHTNIAELDTLVEEVLLASRLDAGAAIDRTDQLDLLGLAAEEAARTGAELSVQGDAARCVVTGNERLLRRALRNLLENARRYGGDAVTLALHADPPGWLTVRVSDRGPGVPPEYRSRIFEPYFRLPGHAEREGGVGLGLSLVRQIADAHGGRVHCEAREGGGSVFVFSLPTG
jgi:signal transduction histidine kinase